MGGLSKKALQLEKLRQTEGTPDLTLDAGGLLFKNPQLAPLSARQEKMTAVGIVESYNFMGYNAVGVSGRDLAGGVEFLRQLARISKFSWLSANLVRRANLEPIFKSSVVIPVGSLRVGVIGLTNPGVNLAQLGEEDAVILPWHESLSKEVGKLAGQTDLLILLSNLEETANQAIAKEFNLHLILLAEGVSGNLPPRQSGNTLLSQTGPQGKYLGQLAINWTPSHRWGINLDETQTAKNERQEQSPPPSTYSSEFIAIQASMPDQPEVARLVQQLHAEVNSLNNSPAAAEGETPYLGSKGCFACHPQQEKSWRNTRHAHAYQTLVRRQKENNLDCLHCHLTGVKSEFEPSALTLPEERQNVGCESCHGPGRRHAANPSQIRVQRLPAIETCLGCHRKEHDEAFDYEKKILTLGCAKKS